MEYDAIMIKAEDNGCGAESENSEWRGEWV